MRTTNHPAELLGGQVCIEEGGLASAAAFDLRPHDAMVRLAWLSERVAQSEQSPPLVPLAESDSVRLSGCKEATMAA